MGVATNTEAKIGNPEKRVVGRAVSSRTQEGEFGVLVKGELAKE